jgi:hypothetical protein
MAATYSTSAMVLGGRFALSVQLPVVSIKGDFDLQSVSGVPVGPFSLSDSQFGLGDLAVIPMLGYDSGSWHFNFSAPVYVRRQINWNRMQPEGMEALAHLGFDVMRHSCGEASGVF